MKKIAVLISGGLDSSTALKLFDDGQHQIYGISFFYDQKQKIELERIKNFTEDIKNLHEHKIINIDFSSFSGCSLINKNLAVPKYSSAQELGTQIPSTYVPARNTIFLSFALGYAEAIGANEIVIGVHNEDAANYPDCRPEYIKAFENLANIATASGTMGHRIKITTPWIDKSKSEILKIGFDLGVDYSKTLSCYDPNEFGESCGSCHACLIRLEAFEKNGARDPIKYSNTH